MKRKRENYVYYEALCEALNTRLQTTGTKLPSPNGLVERHNLVLSESLNKVLEVNRYFLDIALASWLNAKKSLHNVQLVTGQKILLPYDFNDIFPAMSNMNHNEVLRQHVSAIHKAREAFITNENSQKIRRASRQNIWTSNDNILWKAIQYTTNVHVAVVGETLL